jgi:hypothetical protein
LIETKKNLSGHTKLSTFSFKKFFVAARDHWIDHWSTHDGSYYIFIQVDFCKTSFTGESCGGENEPTFVCLAKKNHFSIKFSVEITLRWIDPPLNRPTMNDSRWIDPAMNRTRAPDQTICLKSLEFQLFYNWAGLDFP